MAKLVVFTGYPTCGKSTLSRFLDQDLGFIRLSGDEISEELFGHTHPYADNEDPEEIWKTIYRRRDRLLAKGRDVVIDTTAYDEQRRSGLFAASAQTEKYLVWLQVSPETMARRAKGREWTADDMELWKAQVGWEDPQEGPCLPQQTKPQEGGYHLLVYANDVPDDLERIKSDLRKQFT